MKNQSSAVVIFAFLSTFLLPQNLFAQRPDWFDHITVLAWASCCTVPISGVTWGGLPYSKEDLGNLAELVEDSHSRGEFYHASMHFSPEDDVNLDRALSAYDLDGNIAHLLYGLLQPIPNLHHPAWRDTLITWVKRIIDIGADGVTIDGYFPNIRAIEGVGGSFDDYTMEDFRQYLDTKYSAEDLLSQFDIQDISTFHFRDWIIKHGLRAQWDARPYHAHNFPLEEPLMAEFWLFEWQYAARFFAEFATTAKEYALSQYGKNFVITENSAGSYYNVVDTEDFITG